MSVLLAKYFVTGDDHYSSNNRGNHKDYSYETLYYARKKLDIAKERGITHWISTGDFTYGRFNRLEYRIEVEKILQEQRNLTNGNHYMIKGNHDISNKGMTEYEYYLDKGMFKSGTNITVGNCNINMVDHGKHETTDVIIEEGKTNLLFTHGCFTFNTSNYFKNFNPIILDNFEKWFGIDMIISGHIHTRTIVDGVMYKGNRGKKLLIDYLPCLSRPEYKNGDNEEIGYVAIVEVYDDTVKYEVIEFPLLPLEESFALEKMKKDMEHKETIRINMGNVVSSVNSFDRNIGNPEDIINGKMDVSKEIRDKAIELYRNAG